MNGPEVSYVFKETKEKESLWDYSKNSDVRYLI